MARRTLIIAFLVGSSAFAATPVEAATRIYELGYFLPTGVAGTKVAQRLVSCPRMDADQFVPPAFEYSIAIDSKTLADPRLISVDANNGFLAKRTTELKLRPDGTLEAFNASNEGQGGAVIAAVLKTFAAVISSGVAAAGPSATPLTWDCTQNAKNDLEAREAAVDNIAGLEAQVADGHADPGVLAELANQRKMLERIDDRLTVTTKSDRFLPAHGQTGGSVYIAPADTSRFFKTVTRDDVAAEREMARILAEQPGSKGYVATWTANAALQRALGSGQVAALPTKATPYLYYRRPVPATIEVAPCMVRPAAGAKTCVKDESQAAEALQASGQASFPQLSGYFYIPIGRGGLFGSEEAAAEFDATGAPIKLKYGSDPGAAGLPSVIDAAREGYTSLDGASAAARQAHLDDLKRRKEIRELEDELSRPLPAPAPAPAPTDG